MNSQKKIFWGTIDIFDKIDILKHIIIIGSWAEYIYELGYLNNFTSNLKTMDIDFLIKNIHLPRNKIDIIGILEDNDYLISTNRNGITKFFKGAEIEIEFLAREIGKGQVEPYKFEPLGIKVEGLRHMDLLCDNTIIIKIESRFIFER